MKSKDDAEKMIKLLKNELQTLPSHNIFGDSNDDERREIEDWIHELTNFFRYGNLPPDQYSEVFLWIDGERHSALNDIG